MHCAVIVTALATTLLPVRAEDIPSQRESASEVLKPSPPNETQSGDPPTRSQRPSDFWTRRKLTGDWGGLRSQWEDGGITFKPVYNQQFMVNMHGGMETANGNDFAGSYELNVELDFDKMGLVPHGSFFIRAAKGTWGGEISDFDKEKIGGLFKTIADAKAEEPIFVNKWWWRQRFHDDRIEIRLGNLVTIKDLFDVNKVAGSEDRMFMNAALVGNPTIPHKLGLGAYVNIWPTDLIYIRAAVIDPESKARRTGFDTAFHGEDRWRFFGELGLAPLFQSERGLLPGHYRFGTWYRPYPKTVFQGNADGRHQPRSRSGDVGFYFGCDQLVWKENSSPKDKQGLSVFARYGSSRDDVNKIETFWSVGAQYVGFVPGREKDVIAFGMAQGILSDRYRREINSRADRETVFELYYSYRATRWCIITPDIQFITNPGGHKDDRDALVAGLRMRLLF